MKTLNVDLKKVAIDLKKVAIETIMCDWMKNQSQLEILPIFPHLKEICDTLKKSQSRFLILTAETGAGKSTAVPLALLEAFPKKILMLEPRRLAATAIANRDAELLGEQVGQTCGYRVYLENKVSEKTRLELMTEAILTRRLQNDPELSDTSVVVLDEFHERSVNADLALAFLKEAMALRDDLFVVIMSATIDAKKLASFCGTENQPAPVMEIPGRTFPVDFIYKPGLSVAGAVRYALENLCKKKVDKDFGMSVLVFLPGIYEIKKTHADLQNDPVIFGQGNVQIFNLHSSITLEEQKKILKPSEPGTVRIILSSSIAETSVTIPDVVCVIDSGLSRYSEMNNNVGAAHLVTVEESEFSAAQRAGRAGRTQAGTCIRLWGEKELRQKNSVPEILRTDLSGLVLECAEWGCPNPENLSWLEKPADSAWKAAGDLLFQLGCIDGEKKITPLGSSVLKMGLGPRLGCVALFGSAKDALPYSQYKDSPEWLQKKFLENVEKRKKEISFVPKNTSGGNEANALLAGFPDRLGIRVEGQAADYQFASGRVLHLKEFSGGLCPKYIVAPEVDAGEARGTVYSYRALEEGFAEEWLFARATKETLLDLEGGKVKKTEFTLYGKIVLAQKALPSGPEDFKAALCASIKKKGFDSLVLDERTKNFLVRRKFFEQETDPEKKFSKEFLEQNATEWLLPFITQNKITAENVYQALYYFYDGGQVEQKVPLRITLETGRSVKVVYMDGEKVVPTIEIIIQQIFGCFRTPKILGVPVLLKLLSPARRPLQITSDLENFWTSTWPEICKEMKGRYPKHNWDYRVAQSE